MRRCATGVANKSVRLHFALFKVGEEGVGNTGEVIPVGDICAAISESLLEGSVEASCIVYIQG